jgi:hypothetical protein
MRDPVFIDPDEAATYRFLKGYVQSESWKADPDGSACDMRAAIDEVEASNLPEWAKNLAILALLEQTRKRRGKPTRGYRDMAIRLAAIRLVLQGYRPTRNDVTIDTESAASIIHRALQRLGERLSEKSINTIVANDCREVLEDPATAALLRRVLK